MMISSVTQAPLAKMPRGSYRPAPNRGRSISRVRLVGGRPCLDFVNTVHDRFAAAREDYLADADRYLAWAVRTGLLARGELTTVRATGIRGEDLIEIRRFREQLHALLSARIDATPIPAPAMRALEHWIRRAWRDLQLNAATPGFLAWNATAVDARLPLKRIALSALDLLQHGDPARLKRCALSGHCGWLFYDESKNNRRRWCAMDTCGAPEKMRRYRARQAA